MAQLEHETEDFDPQTRLRRHMEADAIVLSRAAARLRWLGWFWFFTFGVMFVFSLAFAGVGRLNALVIGLVLGFILIGISLFYFALANYVSRGHRWAIGTGLFLVTAFVAILPDAPGDHLYRHADFHWLLAQVGELRGDNRSLCQLDQCYGIGCLCFVSGGGIVHHGEGIHLAAT